MSTLDDLDWAVRTSVYGTFARTGRAPALGAVAADVGATEHRVKTAVIRLYEAHEIAPRPGGDAIWMANPFSAVPTAYPVRTPDFTCWAACAWDAFGVPAILGMDAWIGTACPQSGAELEFGVRSGRLEGDEGVVHLVTPLRHAWDDIGFT